MKKRGKSVLKIVQKYHPEVTSVIDATEPITIEVSKEDCRNGKLQEPDNCAMAKALSREYDGAIISLSTSYIISGTKAFRYRTPESVAREIVSFDRDKRFAPGEYHLAPQPKSSRVGYRSRKGFKANRKPEHAQNKKRYHRTAGLRSL